MGLMARYTQHRPPTLTNRAHELMSELSRAWLLKTVKNSHSERLQTIQRAQKYINRSVFAPVPTLMSAIGHNPVTLMPQPTRHRWLNATGCLKRESTTWSTTTINGGHCVPASSSAATSQPVTRARCLE